MVVVQLVECLVWDQVVASSSPAYHTKIKKIMKERKGEWPIIRFWYTQKKGQTIEHIIDTDTEFFRWAVRTFQNITPKQAQYYFEKTGRKVNPSYIQDVEPYDHHKTDSDKMYIELCETQDLTSVLIKYRGIQQDLF